MSEPNRHLPAHEEELIESLLRERLAAQEPRAAFGPALLERLLRGGRDAWPSFVRPWVGAVALLVLVVTAGAGYRYFLQPGGPLLRQYELEQVDLQAVPSSRTIAPSPAPRAVRDEAPASGIESGEPPPMMQLFKIAEPQDADQEADENAANEIAPPMLRTKRATPAASSGSVSTGSGGSLSGSGSVRSSSSK